MPMPVTMTMMAKYVWKLVFDYDNSGSPTPMEHTYALTQSGSYNPMMFNEFVSKEAKKLVESGKLQSGASYRPSSVTFMTGHQMSKEVSSFLQNMTMDQPEKTMSYDRMEVRKVMIGPKSRMMVYQRTFEAPGMIIQEDTLKMIAAPLPKEEMVEEVPMQMMMVAMKFVKGLKLNQVVSSDNPLDAPSDRVRDWFGGSDEMNYMYGGKFVWIVPIMTTQVSEALTSFDLVITPKADPHHDDLAKDAGGSHRYLIPIKQTSDLFMTELTLARFSSDAHLLLPTMFWPNLPKGFTSDINMERGGGYLYLVWKMQKAYPV
ncbi:hypothetical protein C0995_016135 [Termitomyces sp. Mi166|nr:hypothetical protein C0995_016135 [Termitomyces sp. Mi166\